MLISFTTLTVRLAGSTGLDFATNLISTSTGGFALAPCRGLITSIFGPMSDSAPTGISPSNPLSFAGAMAASFGVISHRSCPLPAMAIPNSPIVPILSMLPSTVRLMITIMRPIANPPWPPFMIDPWVSRPAYTPSLVHQTVRLYPGSPIVPAPASV